MSQGNYRLKEISDKYWSVVDSIFGYKEDVDSYKFILDEPNETEVSNEALMKAENASLNLQLMDALNDRHRDGLVTLSCEIMIEVNNKILAEDYDAALSIVNKGIGDYGAFRELCDLKKILERKCFINRGSSANQRLKPALTLSEKKTKINKAFCSSSSGSEYSSETQSRSLSSTSCTGTNQTLFSSNDMSLSESDDTVSYFSSSANSDSTKNTDKVSEVTNSTISSSKQQVTVSGHDDDSFLLALKQITVRDSVNISELDEDDSTDIDDGNNANNEEADENDYFIMNHAEELDDASDDDDDDDDDDEDDDDDDVSEDESDEDLDNDNQDEKSKDDSEQEEDDDVSDDSDTSDTDSKDNR